MKIRIAENFVSLEEGNQLYTLLEKPETPDYSNVTARPYFSYYYTRSETIWERFCFCMEKLPNLCPDHSYLGCYALIFRRLYPLLLSSSQAKNVIAYGPPTDCGAYKVFQDFMSFLQEGSALTALAQSPFSLLTLSEHSCHAFLYCLDTCPAPAAVFDAISKVRPGGLILLYTIKDTLPAELNEWCAGNEKDSFGSCTVYTLSVDAALAEFALANGTEAFLLSRADEIIKRVYDLQNLVQTMLAGTALPEDACSIAVLILQQIEELLLSVYDYLNNDELPVFANALKEAVLDYHVGISRQYSPNIYREKLTQSSEIFFTTLEREFQ